ncbi:hypothetical protein [Mycobacteroides abscessus]|nr:hypothetical protein [Mycobacteroides abscessus]
MSDIIPKRYSTADELYGHAAWTPLEPFEDRYRVVEDKKECA